MSESKTEISKESESEVGNIKNRREKLPCWIISSQIVG